MRKSVLLIYVLIAVLSVGISGGFASTGIVENDPERNIILPDDRLIEVKAKLAYNGEDVFWRFEWDAGDNAAIVHDLLEFRDGKWQQLKTTPQDENRYMEDRFSIFLDDGSVEYFEQYGGFITATSDMRYMTSMADPEETEKYVGRNYLRKFLPETRYDKNDWRTLKSEEDLDKLVESGYFLDFWHWKAHRSNPIGYVDDNWLLHDRKSDKGGLGDENWDKEIEQPKFMFDPKITGQYAMSLDKVKNREYTTEDYYFLNEANMIEFDPNHEWQEGDILPNWITSIEEDSSRSNIFAKGVLMDGKWHLDMQRAMDTGNPNDDKILHEQGKYTVAFGLHRNTSSRYHLTSFPHSIGFDREAEIEAVKFKGQTPPWDEIEWNTIQLFFPGQISWDHAFNSEKHAGGESVKNKIPIKEFHTEEEFSYYGIESEFRSEIVGQWVKTMGGVSLFFVLFSFGVIRTSASIKRSDLK